MKYVTASLVALLLAYLLACTIHVTGRRGYKRWCIWCLLLGPPPED